MQPDVYAFSCPSCAITLSVPRQMVGVTGPCPACGQTITAPPPEPESGSPFQGFSTGPQPSAARGATAPVTAQPNRPKPTPAPADIESYMPPPAAPPRSAPMESVRRSVPEARRPEPVPVPTPTPRDEPGPWNEAPASTPVEPAAVRRPIQAPDFNDRPGRARSIAAPAPASKPSAGNRLLLFSVFALIVAAFGMVGIFLMSRSTFHRLSSLFSGHTTGVIPTSPTEAEGGKPPAETPKPVPTPAPAPLPKVEPPAAPPPTVGTAPDQTSAPSAVTAPEAPTRAPEVGATAPTPAVPKATPAAEPPIPAPPKAEPVAPAPRKPPPSLLPEIPRPGDPPPKSSDATQPPSTDPPPPVVVATANASVETKPGVPTGKGGDNSYLAEPRAVLDSFFAAPTWEKRLAFCRQPGVYRDEMEEFYRTEKDGPESPTSVTFHDSARFPGGKRGMMIFTVHFPDLVQGMPVALEKTLEGWKVDWRSYAEFRSRKLKKYLAAYQESPGTFLLQMRRAHSYDTDVPDKDSKFVFNVSAPINGDDGEVFADRNDSIVKPKLADKLSWDDTYYVVAKLKWVKSDKGHAYVVLRDIVSDSWWADPGASAGSADSAGKSTGRKAAKN